MKTTFLNISCLLMRCAALQITLLLSITCFNLAQAQSPSLSIQAGQGRWRHFQDQQAYSEIHPNWNHSALFGLGMQHRIKPHWSPFFDLGLVLDQYKVEWRSSKDTRSLSADMRLLNIYVDPGLEFHGKRPSHLFARLALGLRFKAGGSGDYRVRYFSLGNFSDSTYTGGMNSVRRTVLAGPKLSLGYVFDMKTAGKLRLGLTFWITGLEIWENVFDTPYNPRAFQSMIVASYEFPNRKRE